MRPSYRADIDGLRGIAVLLVVIYHLFPSVLRSGFIGVDVFFVISGFLITRLILDGLERNEFSFTNFYSRRIRRIFPALILLLVACLTFGWVSLTVERYALLAKNSFAALGFYSNLLSYFQSGYFDLAAKQKPLLHLWSLGVEEQFYLLWPLTVAFLFRKKLLKPVTLFLIFTSLILNIHFVSQRPEAAFYLPQCRFWEILVGAWIAILQRTPSKLTAATNEWLSGAGALLLGIGIFLISPNKPFPGAYAILPVAGAALMIYAGQLPYLNRMILSSRPLVYLGLISYPLYLWHWSVFSFFNIVHPFSYETADGLVIFAVSLLLSWLTYSFLEKPARSRTKRKALVWVLASYGMVFVSIVPVREGAPFRFVSASKMQQFLSWDYMTNARCEKWFPYPERRGHIFCNLSQDRPPQLLILGDSHANHLYPGFAQNSLFAKTSVLNFGECDPLLGVHWILKAPMHYTHPCLNGGDIRENKFIIGVISKTPSIRWALLTSKWAMDFDNQGRSIADWDLVADDPSIPKNSRNAEALYLIGLDHFVRFLESKHIQVVVALDTPEFSVDPVDCAPNELLLFGKKALSSRCNTSIASEYQRQKGFTEILKNLSKSHPGIRVYDPLPAFCPNGICSPFLHGQLLLRDHSHLSEEGSAFYAQNFTQWAEKNVPGFLPNSKK